MPVEAQAFTIKKLKLVEVCYSFKCICLRCIIVLVHTVDSSSLVGCLDYKDNILALFPDYSGMTEITRYVHVYMFEHAVNFRYEFPQLHQG